MRSIRNPASELVLTVAWAIILLQDWSEELFGALAAAGGTAYSNYAVGYNNVDVAVATKHKCALFPGAGLLPAVLCRCTGDAETHDVTQRGCGPVA